MADMARPPTRYTSLSDRMTIVRMHRNGASVEDICRDTCWSKSTVYRWVAKGNADGELRLQKRSGRPPKADAAMRRRIVRAAVACVTRSWRAWARRSHGDFGVQLSYETIRKICKKAGVRRYKARVVANIRRCHLKPRIDWCRTHEGQDFRTFIFMDEKRVKLINDGRLVFTRYKGQDWDPRFIQRKAVAGGGSLLIVGFISIFGTGPLIVQEDNLNGARMLEILRDTVLPWIADTWPDDERRAGLTYCADNAPPHRFTPVRRLLAEQPFAVPNWPAYSPDLNCIENCWSQLDRLVDRTGVHTVRDLRQPIMDAWDNISIDYVVKLIRSMPTRCRRVIRNRGWPISY